MMISFRQFIAIVMALGILLTSSACTVVARDDHYHGYGPPPHAPAHGYRHHHDDLDLVFDTSLGLYLVFGHPDYYWYDNWYYHWDGRYWNRSKHFKRGWKHSDHGYVPKKLYRKYERQYHRHDRDGDRDRRGDRDGDRDRRGDRDGDRDRRGDHDGDRNYRR
jgi:hypothetical protein